MEIQVRRMDRAVWVSLSGILDRDGMTALANRVAPGLAGRGARVVLEGSGLTHMDYRATRSLVAWHRHLRRRGHALFLQGWSDYLKAILAMEDWDCDRSQVPAGLPTLRHLGSLAAVRMP
jgi:anti-anti-sigma regulatory factor